MTQALHFLLQHGYPVLFVWVFLEQAGMPIPSSPLLLAAGVLAGTGKMEFGLTLGLVTLAAVTADAGWYLWGRWHGAGVLRIVCKVALEPDTCVRRTREAVSRHGRLAILTSKFVPGLNAAAPPLAGVIRMPMPEYVGLDVASSLLWAGTFMGLGLVFSHQLNRLAAYARGFSGAVLGLLILLLGIYIVRKYLARRKLMKQIWTERVEPEKLRNLLEQGKAVTILDMRQRLDFELDPFVIPGATHFHFEDLDQKHGELPRDGEIIVYCT